MPVPPSPITLRTSTPSDIVERWVHLQQEMNQFNQSSTSESSFVHPAIKSSRRINSATNPYRQPVESLTVSFAKLLVNQINGASPTATTSKKGKKNKKKSRFGNSPIKITVRNNKSVTQIDHVEEWLHQRSAHYAWWRKPSPQSGFNTPATAFNRQCCDPAISKNIMVNHSQPHPVKAPRCILWFQFTGNPSKRPGSNINKIPTSSVSRTHSIRIEQQPLGGANALVFAADLHIGEDFAIVSRRQPGFTFSLTFFIDGVRHARLSGCCENARNIHIPTRVGGPIGAFVLRTVQGGEQCHVCEKSAPFADPELFTVWPKSHHRQYLNSSQESDKLTDRSQEGHHYPSRKRSSLRRSTKTNENTPEVVIVTREPEEVSVSYSNEPFDEPPSSEILVPGFTSAEDTFEEQLSSDVIVPSSPTNEEVCLEQPSYEILTTISPSLEEIYEEQVTSDVIIPGSLSIESNLGSPLRTPQSTPSSLIDFLKE